MAERPDPERFRRLPERPDPATLREVHDVESRPDEIGDDQREREWLVKYGLGGL